MGCWTSTLLRPAEARQVDELELGHPERFVGVVLAGDEVVAVSVVELLAGPEEEAGGDEQLPRRPRPCRSRTPARFGREIGEGSE